MPALNKRLLLLILLRNRNRRRVKAMKKRKHKYWVRPTLRKRTEFGQFYGLIPELEFNDREWFYRLVSFAHQLLPALANTQSLSHGIWLAVVHIMLAELCCKINSSGNNMNHC